MAAYLQTVTFWPQVVRMVDHPRRQPQHLAFKRGKAGASMRLAVSVHRLTRSLSLDVRCHRSAFLMDGQLVDHRGVHKYLSCKITQISQKHSNDRSKYCKILMDSANAAT